MDKYDKKIWQNNKIYEIFQCVDKMILFFASFMYDNWQRVTNVIFFVISIHIQPSKFNFCVFVPGFGAV